MNIPLFGLLRRANKVVKRYRKAMAGRYLSPCRRIEFVHAPRERICAMTFDDGPTAAPALPSSSIPLTELLLDILRSYGARATFDVIGSTAENYPDTAGELHTHFVFGRKFDHYAKFGDDALAGALACPEILKRIADEGHELANHGYRHILFGPNRSVYSSRAYFSTLDEVVADLERLHRLVFEKTGKVMRLARPAHYVDRIPDGHSAYDAYARMNYHYMSANTDGGGWLPSCGDFKRDTDAMVLPLEAMLKENPDALSGSIIFQKDGYNMSCQAPIAEALPRQLKLLRDYGYRVTGVGELMEQSPFEDVAPGDPCFEAVRTLERAGNVIGYRNNTFQPDRDVTWEELYIMTGHPALKGKLNAQSLREYIRGMGRECDKLRDITRRSAAIALGRELTAAPANAQTEASGAQR